MADPELDEQLVAAANAIYGSHPGRRALHAKGIYCEGTFTGSPEAAGLSRARHLGGEPAPALIRYSIGGGKPDVHDGVREARGMAVKLHRGDEGEIDLLGVTTPVFVTRTSEDFLELLRLREPDPETGEPDMEKIGAFLGEHPESLPAIQATLAKPPPASYAQLTYNSIHAFKLVDDAGDGTWIRYRWVPEAGEAGLSDDDAQGRDADYLRSELEERLGDGPALFDLVLSLAEDGDPIDDPTAAWPEERSTVNAGRLEVERLVDDPEGPGEIHVFDPTRVPDGIELPDDPILHMRRKAYSVSAYARLDD